MAGVNTDRLDLPPGEASDVPNFLYCRCVRPARRQRLRRAGAHSGVGGASHERPGSEAAGQGAGCPGGCSDAPSGRSYLDMLKVAVFRYLFWLVLVVVFVAGATRVSVFGLGYLLACFYLLLFGTSLLQGRARTRLVLWDCLILYNVTVIISKNMLSVSPEPARTPAPAARTPAPAARADLPPAPAPVVRLRGADAEQLLLGGPALQPRVHRQRLLRP